MRFINMVVLIPEMVRYLFIGDEAGFVGYIWRRASNYRDRGVKARAACSIIGALGLKRRDPSLVMMAIRLKSGEVRYAAASSDELRIVFESAIWCGDDLVARDALAGLCPTGVSSDERSLSCHAMQALFCWRFEDGFGDNPSDHSVFEQSFELQELALFVEAVRLVNEDDLEGASGRFAQCLDIATQTNNGTIAGFVADHLGKILR